jgi:hypothetical protein
VFCFVIYCYLFDELGSSKMRLFTSTYNYTSRRRVLTKGAFGSAVAVAAPAAATLMERILWGLNLFYKNVWQNNFSWLHGVDKRVKCP